MKEATPHSVELVTLTPNPKHGMRNLSKDYAVESVVSMHAGEGFFITPQGQLERMRTPAVQDAREDIHRGVHAGYLIVDENWRVMMGGGDAVNTRAMTPGEFSSQVLIQDRIYEARYVFPKEKNILRRLFFSN
jgi:hypothetical protein